MASLPLIFLFFSSAISAPSAVKEAFFRTAESAEDAEEEGEKEFEIRMLIFTSRSPRMSNGTMPLVSSTDKQKGIVASDYTLSMSSIRLHESIA